MKRALITLIITAFVAPLFAADPYLPTDQERARWTMADMVSWRICFDAYQKDHGNYPEVKTAADARAAFEPVYVAHLPMNDAWGNAYAVQASASGYSVVSAGSDGRFDKQSWTTGGTLTSLADDAVATNEARWLLRHWSLK